MSSGDLDSDVAVLAHRFPAVDVEVIHTILESCEGRVGEAKAMIKVLEHDRREERRKQRRRSQDSQASSRSRRRSRENAGDSGNDRVRGGRPGVGGATARRGSMGGGSAEDDAHGPRARSGDRDRGSSERRKSQDRAKRKRKHKQKAQDKDLDPKAKKKAKRRARRKAKTRRLEQRRREMLQAGVPEEAFLAEIAADDRGRLVAVGNANDITVMHPPREGKGLLVLDMDYTLFDFRSIGTCDIRDLKRPHLDEFLSAVYQEYDLVVWSQTNWQRLETMLTEMGLLQNPSYQFSFVLDSTCMYEVQRHRAKDNSLCVHQVKDLHFIWGKYPEFYNPCNTIHVDDIRRNFALNPGNGLLIAPFDRALRESHSDRTLLGLRDYLLAIVDEPDVSLLDHDNWQAYLAAMDDGEEEGEGEGEEEEASDDWVFSCSSS